MMVVDSSVWIDYFNGQMTHRLDGSVESGQL